MVPPTLYLASSSPRRRQLLTEAGIAFEPFVVPVDEDALAERYPGPLELLGEYLAQRKALAALAALRAEGRAALVLASDTTVLLEGRSLVKPRDEAEARWMLRELRGKEHIVATGVALAGPEPDQLISATAATHVLMREYSEREIADYVATGDPFDKAGGYSIQHPRFHPVERISGCHLGVIGLPVCLVGALLGHWPRLPHAAEAHRDAVAPCLWSAECCAPLPAAASIHHISADEVPGVSGDDGG